MLIVIIVIAAIGFLFAIPSPAPRVIVIEKRVTVVERPVHVHNHNTYNVVVLAQFGSGDAQKELGPIRSSELPILIGTTAAARRYRAKELAPATCKLLA